MNTYQRRLVNEMKNGAFIEECFSYNDTSESISFIKGATNYKTGETHEYLIENMKYTTFKALLSSKQIAEVPVLGGTETRLGELYERRTVYLHIESEKYKDLIQYVKCDNCDGYGYVSDGRDDVEDCPVCKVSPYSGWHLGGNCDLHTKAGFAKNT